MRLVTVKMSINVSVHGNPISISRERMVALDSDKEFDIRRKIRIQQVLELSSVTFMKYFSLFLQVRQQSRKIAEQVRNKVRKEKTRQLNKFGNELQDEFQDKQSRNLSCLQRQHENCMADYGRAYKDAEHQPDASAKIQELNDFNRKRAEMRGKQAMHKLEHDRKEQEKEARKHLEDMRYAKNIEKVRSHLVADLGKGQKFKKRLKGGVTNIQIDGTVININDQDLDCSSDLLDLSVLNDTDDSESSKSGSEHEENGENNNAGSNSKMCDLNNKTKKENDVNLSLPVCGVDNSAGNVSYRSHKNYGGRHRVPCKASESLIAVTDCVGEIEKCKDKLDNVAPCAKVLQALENMDLPNLGLKQQVNDNKNDGQCQTDTFINKFCECRDFDINKPAYNTYCAHCRKVNSLKTDTEQKYSKIESASDVECRCAELIRPCIVSEPCSPRRQFRRKDKSPERTLVFRKTLTSNAEKRNENYNNNSKSKSHNKDIPKHNHSDACCPMATEGYEVLSPIKVTSKRKKSPKKLNKKKSSIHDSNYCLPCIPKTILKVETTQTDDSLPRSFDHFNKFSQEPVQPAVVQKISEESIERVPSDENAELEFQKSLNKQRDILAKERGNKALDKVRLQQEYQKLLQELPLLQKQERLAAMSTHKPSLHMSDDRFHEYERRKQNVMENKFENIQAKANNFDIPPVTLKSIRKSPPCLGKQQPFKTVDVSEEDPQVINVGQWQTPDTSTSSSQESTDSKNTGETLANLLGRVNKQRELLIKEAANIAPLSSLKNVLNEKELIDLICGCPPPTQKVLVETGTSPSIPKTVTAKKTSNTSIKSPKRSAVSSSDTSTEIAPQKTTRVKPRVKKFKIYLKEEGTQTSPCIEKKKTSKICMIPSCKEGFTQTSLPSQSSHKSLASHKSARRIKSQKSLPKCVPKKNQTGTISVKPSVSCQESTSDNVCEIIIRTGDPNVEINSISGVKTQLEETQTFSKKISHKKSDVIIKIKEAKDKNVLPPKNKFEMSTSTSYFSPPVEVIKPKEAPLHIPCTLETCRSSNKYLLHPQKQQTNIGNLVQVQNGSKEINPRLIKYILRLLSMSRQSIDELTISSVSDVSTPQDSVMQTASNLAREKLQTVMEHFKLSVDDLKKFCLSSSSISDSTLEAMKSEEKNYDAEKLHRDASRETYAKKFACASTSTEREDSTQGYANNEIPVSPSFSSEERDKYGMRKVQDNLPHEYRDNLTKQVQQTNIKLPSSEAPCKTYFKLQTNSDRPDTNENNLSQSQSTTAKHRSSVCISSEPVKSMLSTCIKQRLSKATSPEKTSTKEQSSQSPASLKDDFKEKGIQTSSPTEGFGTSISVETEHKDKPVAKYFLTSDPASSDELAIQNPEQFLQFVRESLGMTVEEFSELGFHEMFSRHMELTEYCHDRIRSLMSLIEQIRNEKKEIYTSTSPVDQSITSYLELPPSKSKHLASAGDQEQEKDYNACVQSCLENDVTSSSGSISQDAIDKYLLGIEKEKRNKSNSKDHEDLQAKENVTPTGNAPSFVPMLQGIPKYCEVDCAEQATANLLDEMMASVKTKPPPALLRSNMRGHTNEIPHELSTIVEVDTVMSSRNTSVRRPHSPEERVPSRDISPRHRSSPKRSCEKATIKKKEVNFCIKSEKTKISPDTSGDYITVSPEKTIYSEEIRNEYGSIKKRNESSESANSSPPMEQTESRIRAGLSGIHSLSESSLDTPDELEAMLRKLKLEWAISLVRKTEQALALSSSSSTSDVGNAKKTNDNSSDVSVRESYKRLCKKLASLNESDIDHAQIVSDLSRYFREFHDVSEIPGVADSKNKSQHRTSTPVQHSKSTDSKKSNTNESPFQVDSEISSVKNSSGDTSEHLFLSIPNVTLNTENCSLMKR